MSNSEFRLTTPVAFIIFNRPDTTGEVLERIRKAKPTKLYLISDAPRAGREDDVRLVNETRSLVENGIDWECEVYKNYAEANMGCRDRVASGISWVLEKEDRVIILEDDIVVADDFFRYMQETLEYYKDNERVMMVSGTNLIKDYEIPGDYAFSCFSGIWGWGTWARAWKHYDVDIKDWPQIHKSGRFKCVMNGLAYIFLKRNMDSVYNHVKDTWDIQWDFCRYKYHGLGVVPKHNMVNNIGFGREDATHTSGESFEDFSYGSMNIPMQYNVEVARDVQYDKAYIKKYFGTRKVMNYIRKKLHK